MTNRLLGLSLIGSNFLFSSSTPSTPWTPAYLTGKLLWLDADDTDTMTLDDTDVDQWDDKDSNGITVSPTSDSYKPTYDSANKCVRLNPSCLTISSALSVKSGIAVVRNASGNIQNGNITYLIGDAANSDHIFLLHAELAGLSYTVSLDGSSVNTGDANFNGGALTPGDSSGTNIDAITGDDIFFPLDSSDHDMMYFQLTSAGTFDLIGGVTNHGYRTYLDIHEIILFDAAKSEADRQKTEGYLAHKWGFTDELPADHPYKSAAPTADNEAIITYKTSLITANSFHTDDLIGFWHCGNYDSSGNYITNSPFPAALVDLTGRGKNISLSNFAGTSSSGASGDNTSGTPSKIKLDGTDDLLRCVGRENSNFPQDEFTFIIRLYPGSDALYGVIFGEDKSNSVCIQIGNSLPSSDNKLILDTNTVDLTNPVMLTVVGKTGSGNYLKMYVNDNSTPILDETFADDSWRPSAQSFKININGYVYLIALYEAALSTSDIATNYNAGMVWS